MREPVGFSVLHDGEMHHIYSVDTPRDARGAHNFKGWQARQGYIARLVTGHPYSDSRGYVLEHRLVMEERLGRFLRSDEIVHHINHDRSDNTFSNLELMTDQNRHAESHAESIKRDDESGKWVADPALADKKFRLLNKNTGLMEVKNLSQLINSTYRKSQFEYRGQGTGLQDKNGVDIYEGDILLFNNNRSKKDHIDVIKWGGAGLKSGFQVDSPMIDIYCPTIEVIGNIYEHPELLGGES